MKVLVVEDDTGLADMLAKVLKAHQYQVDLAGDGESGLSLVETFDYDLVLLDLHLPKLDGIHFCQKLRSAGGDVPILLMTAEDATTSKIAGLDAGADDYVTKPLDTGELLARIRALLRRGRVETSPILSWGPVSLNPGNCEALCDSQSLPLTGKEYGMLELFLRNQHRVFSLNALIERLWSFEKMPSENAVRTHIKGLRRKLKAGGVENMIETVYGLGYRLCAEPAGKVEQEIPVIDPMQEIWARHQQKYLDLITHVERVVSMLTTGNGELTASVVTDRAVIERSRQAIHTLKGALGSFGFMASSKIAVQIEQLLLAAPRLSSAQSHQLLDLTESLRQSLSPSLNSSISSSVDHSRQESHTLSLPYESGRSTVTQWLIVDSDQTLIEELIRKASIWGIQTRLAATLDEAQRAIAQHLPTVVMIDPRCMENLDEGLTFLRSLTQQHPDLPVIVATAHDTLSDRVKVLRSSGGCTFLHKPATADHILEQVNQSLAHIAPASARIIALDDDPQILQCLQQLLSPWGFQLTLVSDPVQFWEAVKQTSPDLLILDVEMPELSGLELCQVIRSDPQMSQIPILFLSAHSDPETVSRVFEAGADDYISKPIVGSELVSRILNRLDRLRLLRKLAETDSLTGLSCRRQSVVEINRLISLAARQEATLCVCVLDLDNFKQVNDLYGHEVGDYVLKTFGDHLRQAFRGEDVVARWGGEEFVVGLYNSSKTMAVQRLRAFLNKFNRYIFTGNAIAKTQQQSFQVSFSAGVASYPANGKEIKTLYCQADQALYRAKSAGRNQVLSTDN